MSMLDNPPSPPLTADFFYGQPFTYLFCVFHSNATILIVSTVDLNVLMLISVDMWRLTINIFIAYFQILLLN